MSVPPKGKWQPVVIGPDPKLAATPGNRFEPIKCLLISAVNYDSTSIDVVLLTRTADGSPTNFRTGIDKNFVVRLGSVLIPILDTVPSEHLTGLAGRQVGSGSAAATTTFFSPTCDKLEGGNCLGTKTRDEGLMMSLRLVRPVAVSEGKTVVVTAFDLCSGASSSDENATDDNATNSARRSMDEFIDDFEEGDAAPSAFRHSGKDEMKSVLEELLRADPERAATGRRLLQANGTGGGDGGGAIDPNDPSTCPRGKRHRIVTTALLFPPEMLHNLKPEGRGEGGANDTAANGTAADAAPKYVFPESRRPIVIIRSRGKIAEVRLVNSTQGNVLELDGDVEGNIYWPASVETTYDGKPHSCNPPHHSCVLPLYTIKLPRNSDAYLPSDRYQNHAETEPTTSPQDLDVELALFTVPEVSQFEPAAEGASVAGGADGGSGGGEGGAGGVAQTPSPKAPSSARRAEASGVPQEVGSTPAPSTETCVGEKCRLPVGAADDRFCPNLPLSAEESGVPKKYTTFNWDKWKVRPDRDLDLMNCLDKPIELPACRDLNEVPASQLKDTCLKAMPPTSTYSFVSKLPVNNKWRVPATFLDIMRGVNLPEFNMDFSLVYNFQYSGDTLQVENEFAKSMENGDYLDTNNFTLYNGATEFQGVGAGYDGYRYCI